MKSLDRITFLELSIIEKIIADETWLEGERRRCEVSPRDPVVQENVCQVILRIGQEMRDRLHRETAAAEIMAPTPQLEAQPLHVRAA